MSKYGQNHERVRKVRGSAGEYECVGCHARMAQEWAHRHDTDPAIPGNYRPLCCSCHQEYDNHWNEETRAKVAQSVAGVWASNPQRRVFSEEHRAKMRAAWVRRKARIQGGEA